MRGVCSDVYVNLSQKLPVSRAGWVCLQGAGPAQVMHIPGHVVEGKSDGHQEDSWPDQAA